MFLLKLEADKITKLAIHGVTTQFVQELADVGFNNLSDNQVSELSIHGVDAGFIREIIELGLVEDGEVEKALALPEKELNS